MAREPLPPPQPPKPTRHNFRHHQHKRKRPTEDHAGGEDSERSRKHPRHNAPNGGKSTAFIDRRPPKNKKPKNNEKEGGGSSSSSRGNGAPNGAAKTPKHAFDDADLDLNAGLNRAIARMDAAALAAYLARQTKRFGSDLSTVELADLGVEAGAIRDTSPYDADRSLDNLPDYLEAAVAAESGTDRDAAKQALLAAPSPNGAPHTIVVTGAGLRAADLVRALRPFQTKTSTVSKLVAEAVAFLQSRRTGIAVGTPARLIDLLEQGALSVAHLQRLVVDASHLDQKKRGVLDMKDTVLPVVRWLARPEFKARYRTGIADVEEKEGSAKPLSILFY